MGNGEKCPYTPEQIYGKTNFDGERDICGLEVHARNELDLFMKRLREEDEKQGRVADPEMYEMQELMHDSVMHIIKAFCDCDFSGGVVSYALGLFNKLVNWDPINPITTNPDEWNDVTWDEETGIRTYQAKRCSRLFRDSDDPDNIAHYIDGYVFDCDYHGSYTAGGGLNRKNHPIVVFLENLLETPIVSRRDVELPEIKFETTRVHLDEFQYQMRNELDILYDLIQEIVKENPTENTDGSDFDITREAVQHLANTIIVVDECYVCFVWMDIRAGGDGNGYFDWKNARIIAIADWGGYMDPIKDHENGSPFTQYFNRILGPADPEDIHHDGRSVKALPMLQFASYVSDDHQPIHVIPLTIPKSDYHYASCIPDTLDNALRNILKHRGNYSEHFFQLFALVDNPNMIMLYTMIDEQDYIIQDPVSGYPKMDTSKSVVLRVGSKWSNGPDNREINVYKTMNPGVIPETFAEWFSRMLMSHIAALDDKNQTIRNEIRRRFYEKHPDCNPQYVEASDDENCRCCGDSCCDDNCCGC